MEQRSENKNQLQTEKIHFAIMAIGAASQKMGIPVTEMHQRLKRVNLIDKLILGCYDVLHTQSLKHVAEDVVEALQNWEKKLLYQN